MAGITTLLATNILKLLLTAVAFANVADNAASGPLTNLYTALVTADPTAAGTAVTSETTYTGYLRQANTRDTSGFDVTSGVGTFKHNQVFPQSSSGTPTITHMTLVTTNSGAGALWFIMALTPNPVIQTTTVNIIAGDTTGSKITLS